jgi:hypothetical protein
MSRTQTILVGTLVVQLVLLLVVIAPWASDDASRSYRPLLPELESFTPQRIEIDDGEESLVLDRDGDAWRIEQAEGYPADTAKVDKLIEDLEEIEVRRPVVTGSRYHDALKVAADDNERRLRIWGPDEDEPEAELLIGTSPNYGVQHVRRADEDSVYEVRGLSPWDLTAEVGSWADRQLVEVEAADVSALTLVNPNGRIELMRNEQGQWMAAGIDEDVDTEKVDRFLGSIAGLRLSEPAGRATDLAAYGLEDPAARLELIAGSGPDDKETVTLLVGDVSDEESGKRYAIREGSGFVVVLSKWDADRLIDQQLDDLFVSATEG